MRLFSKSLLIIISAFINGCNQESKSHVKNPEETIVLPKASETSINSFNEFFELFNTDSTFQIESIKFPFKTNLINPRQENCRIDKCNYTQKNNFVILDLHKFENDSNYEISKSVPLDGYAKFTISKIGTLNYKIYNFKTVNKKWILVSCDDISLSH